MTKKLPLVVDKSFARLNAAEEAAVENVKAIMRAGEEIGKRALSKK